MSPNQFESCQTGRTNVNHKEYNATKLSDFKGCMLKIVCGKTTWNPPPSAWISDCWIWDLYISYSLWLGSCIGILVIQYKYIHVHPAIAYMYVYYIYYMYICENCIQPFFPTSQAIQPITPAVAIVHESSVICKARQKRSKATVTRWESCSNSTKPEGPLGWPRSVPRSTKVSPLVGLISLKKKKWNHLEKGIYSPKVFVRNGENPENDVFFCQKDSFLFQGGYFQKNHDKRGGCMIFWLNQVELEKHSLEICQNPRSKTTIFFGWQLWFMFFFSVRWP